MLIVARSSEFAISPRHLCSDTNSSSRINATDATPESPSWGAAYNQLTVLAAAVLGLGSAGSSHSAVVPSADSVLLSGPAGCGKSTLIRNVIQALSSTARVPVGYFHPVSYSTLITLAPADPARGLRMLLDRARTLAPTVLVFDDLDALLPNVEDDAMVSVSRHPRLSLPACVDILRRM